MRPEVQVAKNVQRKGDITSEKREKVMGGKKQS